MNTCIYRLKLIRIWPTILIWPCNHTPWTSACQSAIFQMSWRSSRCRHIWIIWNRWLRRINLWVFNLAIILLRNFVHLSINCLRHSLPWLNSYLRTNLISIKILLLNVSVIWVTFLKISYLIAFNSLTSMNHVNWLLHIWSFKVALVSKVMVLNQNLFWHILMLIVIMGFIKNASISTVVLRKYLMRSTSWSWWVSIIIFIKIIKELWTRVLVYLTDV